MLGSPLKVLDLADYRVLRHLLHDSLATSEHIDKGSQLPTRANVINGSTAVLLELDSPQTCKACGFSTKEWMYTEDLALSLQAGGFKTEG